MAKLMHKDESYTGGGSSGLLPHIVITSDAENTITVTTPSGSTITPTSTVSGVWECDVDEYGTYTITATYDEHEAEDTVVVDTVKVYAVEIHIVTIPDGSTVLPTDDVATWLLCADIKDKSYTTLSQVLDDSETFNALLGDSNACAYMARSTTWALNEGEVPAMTDNTHPSGVCSDDTSSNDAYKAFDNNNSTYYFTQTNSAGNWWLQYEFPTSINISKITYIADTGSNGIDSYNGKLQAYISGEWVDILDDVFIEKASSTEKQRNFARITTSKIRVLGDRKLYNSKYNSALFKTLQFYPNEIGITENQYAMNLLGQYDTACDALLSDSTWASAIANSTYFESVLNVKVPVMTSNTTPEGECIADNEYSATYAKYKAFDGSNTSYWVNTDSGSATDIYIGYKHPSDVLVSKFYVKFTEYVSACTYKLQGYDGTNWHDIGTTHTDLEGTFAVENDTYYEAHRLFIVSQTMVGSAYSCGAVYTLQFYGRTPSSEKIHGGNPTYDSFYRIVDGNNVPVTDPSLLDAGTYTIYSNGLAKDPDNLSNDYGKTIRICPNTKEIVVRPDNSLYWLGSKRYDLEVLNSLNGWTCQTYRSFGGTVNEDDTSMTLVPSAATNLVAVGSNNVVNDDITVHAIGKWLITSGSSNPDAEYAAALTSKSFALGTAQIVDNFANFTNAMSHVSAQFSDGGYVVVVHDPYNSANLQLNIQALWYEYE